jgi:hypothetical protein
MTLMERRGTQEGCLCEGNKRRLRGPGNVREDNIKMTLEKEEWVV